MPSCGPTVMRLTGARFVRDPRAGRSAAPSRRFHSCCRTRDPKIHALTLRDTPDTGALRTGGRLAAGTLALLRAPERDGRPVRTAVQARAGRDSRYPVAAATPWQRGVARWVRSESASGPVCTTTSGATGRAPTPPTSRTPVATVTAIAIPIAPAIERILEGGSRYAEVIANGETRYRDQMAHEFQHSRARSRGADVDRVHGLRVPPTQRADRAFVRGYTTCSRGRRGCDPARRMGASACFRERVRLILSLTATRA